MTWCKLVIIADAEAFRSSIQKQMEKVASEMSNDEQPPPQHNRIQLAQEQQVLLLSPHQGSSSVQDSLPCSCGGLLLTSATPAGSECVALAFCTIT